MRKILVVRAPDFGASFEVSGIALGVGHIFLRREPQQR
jgi:hypothetical protein